MKKPLFINKSFKPQKFKPHFHNSYSIGLITEGEHKLHLRDDRKLIKSGEIKIINPNELHFVDSSSSWSYLNLMVEKDDVYEVAESMFLKEIKNNIKFKNCINEKEAIELFIKLFNSKDEKIVFEENFIEFIEFLLNNYSSFESNPKNFGSIKYAIDFIHSFFLEDISLEDIAKSINLSKYHTIKLFKKYTNLTPHQYILRLRIEEARKLLKKDIPLSQIALQCGFSDQSHFIKEFKKVYGFTPSNI